MAEKTTSLYQGAVPVGGELGTSTSKFCVDDKVVMFSSVVGDALTPILEENWRRMNRSRDRRWIRNLAIWDERRGEWRYVGAMTRSSETPNWFTERGLVQNMDDAYLALQAGLFLLDQERRQAGKPPLSKVGMGFGIPVKAGENAADEFFSYLGTRLDKTADGSFMTIRAKNVATGEEVTTRLQLAFIAIQFQGYGAYMALLFGKYGMKLFNTYVIDIGHGTWIKLPVVDNEVDMLLADSIPFGMHTITENISRVIFEKSRQRYRIPEQRIMEKLPRGESRIEVPGEGIFDFRPVLESEVAELVDKVLVRVRQDLGELSRRGKFIDYFAVVGGGAPLVFEQIKRGIQRYYDWSDEVAEARVVQVEAIGVSPRVINSVGFMLLARDQIAIELGQPVEPGFAVSELITDELLGEPRDVRASGGAAARPSPPPPARAERQPRPAEPAAERKPAAVK
ncbi:MAG: hypothetical protein KatS3mg102_1086 [Planctomycetota bacterium]|nr:MAG: hypothetical protein KatS3mg102_1086 [Planctomycetota bacterium]